MVTVLIKYFFIGPFHKMTLSFSSLYITYGKIVLKTTAAKRGALIFTLGSKIFTFFFLFLCWQSLQKACNKWFNV